MEKQQSFRTVLSASATIKSLITQIMGKLENMVLTLETLDKEVKSEDS